MNIIFFGTPGFAVPSLCRLCDEKGFDVTLVVSQPDRKAGRGQRVQPPPVAREARERGLPLLQPGKIRGDAALLERLRREQPDFLVVVAYGRILPPPVLDVPKIACVNVHASLLPKYRGASPVAAALLAGDRETGVSIMRMTEGLDEGPVYAQHRVPIRESDDAATLSEKLAREGAELLIRTLPGIRDGIVVARPQEGEATHCRTIRKEDGEIDWSRPAEHIVRALKAYTPWPGIFTFLKGERIRILKAAVAEEATGQADGSSSGEGLSPGSILRQADGGFRIACGEGTLLVPGLLQREGRNPVAGSEFLRALPSGDARFGR